MLSPGWRPSQGVHCRHEGATPAYRPQGPEVGIFNPCGLGLEGPDTHVTLRAIAECSESAGPATKMAPLTGLAVEPQALDRAHDLNGFRGSQHVYIVGD